jgi:hypothetical protein
MKRCTKNETPWNKKSIQSDQNSNNNKIQTNQDYPEFAFFTVSRKDIIFTVITFEKTINLASI